METKEMRGGLEEFIVTVWVFPKIILKHFTLPKLAPKKDMHVSI